MKKLSVGVKAAWIGVIGVVLAAIVAGIISLVSLTPSTNQKTTSVVASNILNSGVIGNADQINLDRSIQQFALTNSGLIQGQVNAPFQPVNLTQIFNNYDNSNPSNTGLKEWVANLDLRTSTNTADIQLTRSDIVNLTKLLSKLDERTSGIEKLPDGRTRLGGVIGGPPYVINDAISNASVSFLQGDFAASLSFAEKGIEALHASERPTFQEEIMVSPYGKGTLYSLAARSAQRLNQENPAKDYALKAVELDPNDQNRLLLVTTLVNIGVEKHNKKDNIEALSFFRQAITNFESIRSAGTNILSATNVIRMYGMAAWNAHKVGNTNLAFEFAQKAATKAEELEVFQKLNVTK